MTTSSDAIRILVTGGTFDKEYNEVTGHLYFHDTHVPEMLSLGRCLLEACVEKVMMIDRLDMTEDDRRKIAERCRSCSEHRIVITYGTDTMVETAALLARQAPEKTIVLTKAMAPYKFGSSDGMFNLGSALAFVQSLPPGVYIAMNSRFFSWNRVRKNKQQDVFEPV